MIIKKKNPTYCFSVLQMMQKIRYNTDAIENAREIKSAYQTQSNYLIYFVVEIWCFKLRNKYLSTLMIIQAISSFKAQSKKKRCGILIFSLVYHLMINSDCFSSLHFLMLSILLLFYFKYFFGQYQLSHLEVIGFIYWCAHFELQKLTTKKNIFCSAWCDPFAVCRILTVSLLIILT